MKIYPETYRMDRYQMCENYNIQHYEPGEGFKDWHSERHSRKFKKSFGFHDILN